MISFKPRTDINGIMYRSNLLESFFIETVNPNEKGSIIGVIYRHPSMQENVFNEDYLKPLFESLSNSNKDCHIVGDFNFDLLQASSSHDTSEFLDTMMTNFLRPTITIPTKINRVKSTLIDNILTNQIHPDMRSGNFMIGLSDHLPSFMIFPRKNQNHAPNKQNYYKRSMGKFDRVEFILDFLDIDWKHSLEIDKGDVNNSLQIFNTKMTELLDKHAPLKKVSKKAFKRKFKPWISNPILELMKQKNTALKKYINCKNIDKKSDLHASYKELRNKLTSDTRFSKNEYYRKYFSDNKENLRKVWIGIKEIINVKSKSFDQPTTIQAGNTILTDPKDVANEFNSYFTSIADEILDKRKYEGNKSFRDYMSVSLCNSFVLRECNASEISVIIKGMNKNKASGPNSIPNEILHILKDEISQPLSYIFNLSFSSGVHPDILKLAKTIPVFKKDSRLQVSNYRPISLLSNINKILEKLMYARLYEFLNENNCFYELQFGFRAKHSVNHALINITESVRKALDDGKIACGVFVDLQKAFDTVDHKILIDKLKYYGIRGTANNWLASYLSNRRQFVSILGFESDTKTLRHGVPQGSVLGPLLFLIFINDLNNCIKKSKTYHFADDTNLLNISSSPKKLQKEINIDLKCLYKWLLANKISLNCSKTEIIFFKKPGQKINFDFNIKMNGLKLHSKESIKYLGIFLNSDLSGKKQCSILTEKLVRSNGMLAKARHFMRKRELLSLYYAIFASHLSYACQVWFSHNSVSNKISNMQKKLCELYPFLNFMLLPTLSLSLIVCLRYKTLYPYKIVYLFMISLMGNYPRALMITLHWSRMYMI